MRPLTRADLLGLETYAIERDAFRVRVRAHKRPRTLRLGDDATLLFEDRLTVQYQIQEMLRIERIFEPAAIQQELDAYNPLIPDGRELKATLLLEYPDPQVRRAALARLAGIERALYAEIAGHGHATLYADEDMARSDADRTAAVHFLRFVFTPAQIVALRDGAGLCVGIDDPRMPVRVEVVDAARAALIRDFD